MNNRKKKILITGAAGLLGQALLRTFRRDHDPIAVINRTGLPDEFSDIDQVEADLADPQAVRSIIEENKVDSIINSAAWVDVDGCELDRKRAYRANYLIAKNIADTIENKQIDLIQISTDYIFNGKRHPGKVDDPPMPLNYYGETKLMAEKYINQKCRNYLIARTCALVGAPNQGQTNLINYFYESLESGKEINAPADLRANPIWVNDLSELLLEAVERRIQGVAHLAGKDYLSRYEFACIFAEVFEFNIDLVIPVSSENQDRPATRPSYAGLDISETELRFETPLPTIRDMLERMKKGLA